MALDEADWWLYELEGEKEPIDGETLTEAEYLLLKAKNQQTSLHLTLSTSHLQKVGVYCEEDMHKMVNYRIAQIKNKESILKIQSCLQKIEPINDINILQILPP